MIMPILTALMAPLALQAATTQPHAQAPAKPQSLADVPITESTAPRCGIAFAMVDGWQNAGDPRGNPWPNIANAGGREFFVVAMARLIDSQGLEREDISRLVDFEVARHRADNGEAIAAMMPACLSLLETSGIQG